MIQSMHFSTFPYLQSFGTIVDQYLDDSGHVTGCEVVLKKTDELDLSLFQPCRRPFYSTAAMEHLLWAVPTIAHYEDLKNAKKKQSQPVTFLRGARNMIYEISSNHPDRAVLKLIQGNVTSRRIKMRVDCFRNGKLVLTSDFIGAQINAEKAKILKKLRDSVLQQNPEIDDRDFNFLEKENKDIFFADFNIGERVQCLMTLERSLANHPLFSGSGDHVNTQMFTDQLEKLLPIWLRKKYGTLHASKQWFVKEYNLDLQRVVELGRIFEIEVESCSPWNGHGLHMTANVYQFDNLCVQVDMSFLPDVLSVSPEAKL